MSSQNHPLLVPSSIAELRAKLTNEGSPLARWWRQTLALAREDGEWFYSYVFLAALVTDEPVYRELARKAFVRFVDAQDEGLTSNDAQFHTHTTSAPLGRWAIYYDWLADRSILSRAEDEAVRQAMLDHGFVFSQQHLQSRMRGFENQILANAWGAAAVGYVLGIRRGGSQLARRLYASGMTRLLGILNLLPAGGYSLEGSTYHEQVVQPLILLSSLLVEHATGQPVMQRGSAPAHRPVRELLETSFRMIGPDGLLPPWDAYGYQAATIKAGITFLARITRDPRPLAAIRDLNMWYRVGHPAWEVDDSMWTLVFWPEDLDASAPAVFEPWLIPSVAGALQTNAGRVRLFQCWDTCGGVPHAGRLQMDPNAVSLHAYDSTILLDGGGKPDANVLPLPAEAIINYVGRRTIESLQEYCKSAWNWSPPDDRAAAMAMDGSVGMANSLVIDSERWYVPLNPTTGAGEAIHHVGALQALRSDATRMYTDRYDVTRVARSSVMIDHRYVITSDHFRAQSPHRVTWQVFARRETTQVNGRAVIETPERVRCDLVPLQAGEFALTPVPDYPVRPDPGSVRVEHTPVASSELRIDVALVPQPASEAVQDLTDGWSRRIAGRDDTVSLRDAYLTDPQTHAGTPRVYTRRFNVASPAGGKHDIVIRFAPQTLELRVNDALVPSVTQQPRLNWEDQSRALPLVFDVSPHLRAGENTITITAPYFHGESACGPVTLTRRIEPARVEATRVGERAFRVSIGGKADDVLVDHEGGEIAWAGGSTDARYAVATSDGRVAAAAVTRLILPGGVRLRSQSPCDFAHSAGETQLAAMSDGSAVEAAWPGATLHVEYGACTIIQYVGRVAHKLKLALRAGDVFIVNGGAPNRVDAAASEVDLPATELRHGGASLDSPEAVYAAEAREGVAARKGLVAALERGDWRTQTAAADVVGRLGIAEALPVLLRLFADAERELPYPPLKKWWTWSKMLHDPSWPTGPDTDAPRPLAIKRWRVKRAVVTALGQLGDASAAPPLEAALLRCDDFFPVTSQLAAALGRIGSRTSVAVLRKHVNHAEVNTREHARLALALIEGEIDRKTFEARVNPL